MSKHVYNFENVSGEGQYYVCANNLKEARKFMQKHLNGEQWIAEFEEENYWEEIGNLIPFDAIFQLPWQLVPEHVPFVHQTLKTDHPYALLLQATAAAWADLLAVGDVIDLSDAEIA